MGTLLIAGLAFAPRHRTANSTRQDSLMLATGLDMVLRDQRTLLGDRRVGLLTHAAAVLPDLGSTVDALLAAGVRLSALFGPEHGVRGAAGAGDSVADATDARTGLPVYSLYGPTKEPTDAMLADVDLLVFDMQDVGARYYTYISTLFYALRGAARSGTPIMVLDRPNPLNGSTIEGPLVAPGYASFVGIAPLPVRHALTIAELALYLNATYAIGAELHIVAMAGWRRSDWFDATGRAWVPTSPALGHLSAVTLYPGTCLIEGTNLSLGRGTALAFEICGAPWLDGAALATRLNALALPGVRFRPLSFIPAAAPFAGQECSGVQAHITDRHALRPVALGLHMVAQAHALDSAHFAWNAAHFDRLIGNSEPRAAIAAGEDAAQSIAGWHAAEAQFAHECAQWLRYP